MRHKDCIFKEEEDCLKNSIDLSCDICGKCDIYKDIEKALIDFVSLGEDITEVFKLHLKLMNKEPYDLPVDQIKRSNEVIAAFLTSSTPENIHAQYYRRTIMHCFKLILDEYTEEEYAEEPLKH